MKQIVAILIIAAFAWLLLDRLGLQPPRTTLELESSNPQLTIDGRAVEQVFRFSNATVLDGDSLRLEGPDFDPINIRLASIDAPEWQQNFGSQAKQHLSHLLGRQSILAWQIGTDRYDRILAFLFIEQPNGQLFEINAQMIRDGFAWHYRQHSSNPILDNFEQAARSSKLGLWHDTTPPIPPWEFRKR